MTTTTIDTTAASRPAHLEPSELGTREYWDTTYTADLSHHPADAPAEGHLEGWFDDVDASTKILSYLRSSAPLLGIDPKTATVLDVGTGNGSMLFSLRGEGGFAGRLLGVDYSVPGIELCRRLAREKGWESGVVGFRVWDVLRDERDEGWGEGFDVVLDKGTFDAVSLSGEVDEGGRRVCEGYRERVEPLVKPGGVLLITSCNWTERELKGWFESEDGLEAVRRIEYPVFTFGGQTGQSVCSVCFRRRRKFP